MATRVLSNSSFGQMRRASQVWQLSATSPPQTNLRHWWDVSDASTITFGTGTKVAALADKIGGKHFVQATADNQPARSGSQNGRATLVFGGDPVRMTAGAAADWKFLHDGTDYTVMAVCKVATSLGVLISTGRDVANFTGLLVITYNPAGVQIIVANGGSVAFSVNSAVASGMTADAWHVLYAGVDPDNGTALSRATVRVDGGAAKAGNALTTACGAGDPTYTLHLGSTGVPGYFMVGEVAELLIYNGVLTDAVRDQVENYLGQKWAITVA